MGRGYEDDETVGWALPLLDEEPQEDRVDACVVHISETLASARTHVLREEVTTVGRSAECHIVIPCNHVSRVHAHLARIGNDWVLLDKSSVNGILVNGVKQARTKLKYGDRLDFGRGEILLYRPYDSDYQRAIEAQRLESLGRLASGIAHDFNNVLMTIVGAASCLEDDVDAGNRASISETIDDMITASQRGASLARQLLTFSRRGHDVREALDVGEVIGEVIRMVERTFDQSISVTSQVAGEFVIEADAGQLTQVLMNLCINARDAMPEGGQLAISVEHGRPHQSGYAGNFARIEIRDTGIGMSPEVREKIFEPFFSTKGEGRGTGLGLATTYGIVRKYGGTIEVESKLGFGTSMVVYLPLAAEGTDVERQAVADVQYPLPVPEGQGRRILLAEDQTLVRRHTARMLRRLGFEVVEATDGAEAIRIVENHGETLSLALIDLQMPRCSGDEACRTIHALDGTLPLVIVSGNAQDHRIGALVDEGDVEEVLNKPFSAEELAVVLMRAR